MINQILNIVFMTLTGTAQGLAMEYMMEIKKGSIQKAFRIIYWTVLAFIPSIINVFIGTGENTIIVRTFIHWGLVFVAIIKFYAEPMWRKLLAVVVLTMGVTSGELMLIGVLQFEKVAKIFYVNDEIYSFFVGIGNFLSIGCIALIAVVWKKLFYKGRKTKYLWFFILYVSNYIINVTFMVFSVWTKNLTSYEVWPVFTAIICEIAIIGIIFSQSEKETLEQNLIKEKQKSELEDIFYQEMKKRRKEIFTIHEQNKSQLMLVKDYLTVSQNNKAEETLIHLSAKIESTREYPYCDIPVINAILSEKKRECEEKSILFDVDIVMPKDIKIQQMDLCSVLGNLLDNAIRACARNKGLFKDRGVKLTIGMSGKYLIIKCKNLSEREPGMIPDGTGYGFKILKDIAQRYEGTFQSKYDNYEFLSQIMLKNE